ncbi:hypothetical protein [Roseateles oligotrophus]|uniref:DUF1043 family protein n=1 Tax=Roseateles oligotrophus TaxID=1769250 RepID=A0ABT2YBU7_9BURK|nr:hypothetical protein [Roseateles oligotrophus]MCV2366500.1 hypothetical protein [Roseateles oligotrophus]
MDSNAWLIGGSAAVLAAGLAWLGAMWWFGRKLAAAAARVGKLEKARQTLNQQNSQARKQVEQLQAELAELRHTLTRQDAAKAQQQRVHAARQSFEDSGPFIEATDPVATPADGFADTHFFMPKKD